MLQPSTRLVSRSVGVLLLYHSVFNGFSQEILGFVLTWTNWQALMSCECNLIKLSSQDRNGSVKGNEERVGKGKEGTEVHGLGT